MLGDNKRKPIAKRSCHQATPHFQFNQVELDNLISQKFKAHFRGLNKIIYATSPAEWISRIC